MIGDKIIEMPKNVTDVTHTSQENVSLISDENITSNQYLNENVNSKSPPRHEKWTKEEVLIFYNKLG
jgi:hypothetical protein